MPLLSYKCIYGSKLELKSKYCLDLVLQPLTSHVALKIKGSLTSEDIIRIVVSLAVDKNSVHSVSIKRGPQVIDEDKFRFEVFILLIEEWIRRKLRVRTKVWYLR